MTRPFRFGVSIWGADSRAEWRDKARRAESMGFDVLATADHLVDGMLSPLVALTAAADATLHIRLATLVLNNDFRHPAIVARETACLDLSIGGRFELGLGAGHMRHEYDSIGLAFDPPKMRVARMAEATSIIRRLLDGESVTFDGTHYRLDGHRCFPTPTGHVRMLIGGNGRRVLSAAARLADIVGFTGFSQLEGQQGVSPTHFTDGGLAEQIAWVRTAAGARFDQLEFNTLIQGVTLTDDRRATARSVQPLVPALSEDDILSSPYSLIGSARQIAEQILDRQDRIGVSYITVFERDMDAMASVIELLR